MTRTAAREIAVMLNYKLALYPEEPDAFLDSFFDAEYFAALKGEDELFDSFPDEKQLGYIRTLAGGSAAMREELDDKIALYAKNWKIGRISRTAAAVMRTAMYEVLYIEEVPPRAAINEAVEIAKGYDDEETVAFINGILGSFMRGGTDGRAEDNTEAGVGTEPESDIETVTEPEAEAAQTGADSAV